MGILENNFLVLCILMPTIYCGKHSGFLLADYNWFDSGLYRTDIKDYFQTQIRGTNTQRQHSERMLNISVDSEVEYKEESRRSSRSMLLRNLALSVIYKNMILKHRANTKHIGTNIFKNYVISDFTKRQYKQHIKASMEVLVVVDHSIVKHYLKKNHYSLQVAKEKIQQYFKILFAMVNQRYSTIADSSFTMQVVLSDIIIAETRREVSWLERLSRFSESRSDTVLNASRVLRRFQKLLKRNKYISNFDHAILFTSYILSKKRKRIDGLAYVGTMCQTDNGRSASVVQDNGDFQSAGVVAHELAHSLGVSHDGEGVNSNCPASKNFVMAPQFVDNVKMAPNVYHFSSCSLKQLKTFVRSSKARCLLNAPTSSFEYDIKRAPPGKTFDEDVQCQLVFGSSSRFCDQAPRRSDMCSRLWCTSPGENEYTCRSSNRLMALPGTSCGYGQHCHLGECVSFLHMVYQSRIPPRDEDCPMGDGNPATCRKITQTRPILCDRDRLKRYCCESCGKIGHSPAKYYRIS